MTSTAEAPLPSCGALDYGGGMREVSIVGAIEEYLAYHHLKEPLRAFQNEVERQNLLFEPSRASLRVTRDVEDVLRNFDDGEMNKFLEAWQRVMPESFHCSKKGRSLELRLHAHFATLSSRQILQAGQEPDAACLHQDLEPFRSFLAERDVDDGGGEEALMPLFALPFVQRPYAQPNVKDIFSQRWLHELRRDVEDALRSQQPVIPVIYDVLEQQSNPEMGDRAWQSVWAELLRLADTSLDAMALLGQGVPVAPELLCGARQQLELLREHVPGGLELQLKSQLDPRPGISPMSPARSVRSRAATAMPRMPREVNFFTLAQFVCAGAEERRLRFGDGAPTLAAVLRAVLQRIASAESPVAERRGFLVSVACFDVLGVRSRPDVLPQLMSDPGLAELVLGILAVLACEAVGRRYIVANLASVERMVDVLKLQPLDSSLHIQALAAMQRLSLRRAAQDRMIALGIVEWVVGVLGWQGEGQGTPSEFSLEFGSAMLMNLALRSAGKRKCVEQDTLTVALNLMEHWNPQIRTHINGTLYSLLSVVSFRARAKNAGLEGVLRSIHAQAISLTDEISARQIEYLLEQLNPQEQAQGDGAESGEDDEDDDENFLEEEELAGLLLGDRSGISAEEALRPFLVSEPGVVEVQSREFQNCVGRNYAPTR
eukprot:TRINITY_DN60176_c0_g1_i1.p1 TRINITY_DN60176_c0_g1~~TRINITY_DN60176_c0_g1_i1.p1  ORF type:complete len:658 (+),score=147.18 TRINITY_DN60176_c0_g1_i1:126-2099(+)